MDQKSRNRGLYPSVPVFILPVYAVAGGFELGDVIGPAVVDSVMDMCLDVPEVGLCPFGLNEAAEPSRIIGKRVLKDQVVVDSAGGRPFEDRYHVQFHSEPFEPFSVDRTVQPIEEVPEVLGCSNVIQHESIMSLTKGEGYANAVVQIQGKKVPADCVLRRRISRQNLEAVFHKSWVFMGSPASKTGYFSQ